MNTLFDIEPCKLQRNPMVLKYGTKEGKKCGSCKHLTSHDDGTMYANMFIVGIQTPDGQATYHYDVNPYWDMFDVKVLDKAPKWDGHTPAQAIERIKALGML